jgi:two-component system LytT family response regulator
MENNKQISVVIIDDDKEAIFTLQGFLELMPEVVIKGTATTYQKAIRLIKEQEPDLVFLDIEMPGKTGFELLHELENVCNSHKFEVIFHTAYDKYTLQALREAAFDFILKPPRVEELKAAINRFMNQRVKVREKAKLPGHTLSQMVALPTSTGLQFFPKSDIVYIECQKTTLNLRSGWSVMLNNHQMIKLRPNTKASSIISYLGSDFFIPLTQSVIVNISYVSMVEYKTHICMLYPPFDEIPFKISRQFMSALRDKFEFI